VGDLRASFYDGPWDRDGTKRWVTNPPPAEVATPSGVKYELVDADEKLAIYQAVTATGEDMRS
jgi:hypothetical protein